MHLNEYARIAVGSAKYPERGSFLGMVYCSAAANSEAGELYEEFKKAWRDEDGVLSSERREKAVKEMGDVLWYLAALAGEIGTSLEEVARENLVKLAGRYPDRIDLADLPGV